MNNLPKVVACQLISCNVTTRCLTVTGGGSVGKCDRLNQLSCLLGNYNKVLLTYLLIITGFMAAAPKTHSLEYY